MEHGIAITMAYFKQEPVEALEDVQLHEEVRLKSEDSLPKDPEIVPEEHKAIYEIVPIKEEPESLKDDFLPEEDIKQEIIELGEYELNIPVEDASVSNELELAEHRCPNEVVPEKDRPFKCDICDKTYLKKNHLQKHYAVHPEYHNVKCDECLKGFFNERELNKHKRTIHEAKDTYVDCLLCNKQFKSQQTLKQHEKIHNDCEHCCEECGKKFKTRKVLKAHITFNHTSPDDHLIPCTICGKTLKGKGNLKVHMQLHSNDRRFKCSFVPCDKTFLMKSRLKTHEQSHTKDYKFNCNLCGPLHGTGCSNTNK